MWLKVHQECTAERESTAHLVLSGDQQWPVNRITNLVTGRGQTVGGRGGLGRRTGFWVRVYFLNKEVSQIQFGSFFASHPSWLAASKPPHKGDHYKCIEFRHGCSTCLEIAPHGELRVLPFSCLRHEVPALTTTHFLSLPLQLKLLGILPGFLFLP